MKCKRGFAIVVLFIVVMSCTAQEDPLVVMFVNQDDNTIAEEAYESVLTYVRGMNVRIKDLNRTSGPVNGSAETFLDNLCFTYNASIQDGNPPHLILDMTRYDVPSETMKSFTKLLALPTVAGSFGQSGDLRSWRNLYGKQEKYLIQVNPPSDILVEVVREIVKSKQFSNAAILFDDSIVMDHKYKSLLQIIPSRHLINELYPTRIRDQLQKLKALGLVNYFIVGRLNTIKIALDAGDGLKYFDGRFSWNTISLETADPRTNCSKCAFLHVKPKQGKKTLSRLVMLQRNYSLKAEPPIEASFYFDLMSRAILAANILKQKGAYNGWKYTTCDEYEETMNIIRDIDLREQFAAMAGPGRARVGHSAAPRSAEQRRAAQSSAEQLGAAQSSATPPRQAGETRPADAPPLPGSRASLLAAPAETMTDRHKMYFAAVLLLASVLVCEAQDDKLVVMFVNQDGNGVADEAYKSVLQYVREQNIEINDEYRASGNGSDAEAFLDLLCSAYNKSIEEKTPPHLILDMTRYDVPSETTKSFTKLLGLPTVTGSYGQDGDLRQWRNLDPKREKYLIQVTPPSDIIAEVVRAIVNNQNISNAGILFDNSVVMDHKYKSLLQNIPTRHLINELNPSDVRNQLIKFKSLELFNYFIIGRLATIKTALDSGDGLKFFDRKFAWHTISLEKENPNANCSKCAYLHVKPTQGADTQKRLELLQTKYGLKADPPIEASFYFDVMLNAIRAANNLKTKGAYKNFNYTTCNDYEESMNIVRDLDLRQQFTNMDQAEPSSYAPFTNGKNGFNWQNFGTSVRKVEVDAGVIKGTPEEVGTWRAGIESPLTTKNADVLRNMSAVTVYTIVTLEQKPFIYRDGIGSDGKEKFKGYCIDLINEIRNITPFEIEIYHVKDNKSGEMDDKGNWNGMIKDLIDKKADIALGSLSVMAERENVIDFTVPYYDLVGITILMKKPKTPTSLFKFLTVLENEVWLCILAAYFFTSFLMWVFDRWSPYSYQNNREKYKDDEEKREFNLKECLWFCMTSLTPQGGGEAPKNLSGRLVAATWWLFGFIIIASYTANLAAFLTVSRLDTPVESLDDLSKQYKIQYAPLKGSSAFTYFDRMAAIENRFYEIWKDMSLNDSLSDVERSKLAVWDYPVSDKYTKVLQAMTEAKFPDNMTEVLKRVRDSKTSSEGFAFIGDATDIKYLQLTNCDLQVVGEEFSRKPYALAVQQGSPLKDQFNNAILQLLNKRKLEKLKERWWNQNPEKKTNCEKLDDQSDGISIQNIGGVFIVIFVGIGLALVTLAFEYFWYKVKKNPKVIDVGPAGPQAPSVPSKKDVGFSFRGFRPRLPFGGEKNFNRGGVPSLAGVTNPW